MEEVALEVELGSIGAPSDLGLLGCGGDPTTGSWTIGTWWYT